MSTMMGYEPYYPPTSSSSSSNRRWYAEVTASSPRVMAAKRPHAVYSSRDASPLSSSTRLRYSSSPGGRVFQPSSASSASYSSTAVERELSQAARVGSEFRAVRTRERAQLQDLNDRFAGFVERVHELELQNRVLAADLELLRRRHTQPSRLESLYEREARDLKAAVDQAQAERQEALGRREHLEQTLGALRARLEEEALAREETEARQRELRDGADRAALARAEVEKRLEALLDELAFLKKVHEEEVAELQAQVHLGARVAMESESSTTAALDLSGALREIRAQYEGLAAKNMRSAEDWFRGKEGSLTENVAQHSHAVRSSKGEAGEVRSQLQAQLLEIDSCRGINHSLEKQLCDAEERQGLEIAAMQEVIEEQERELGATKEEMTRYLKEYQDLLNVKMALDIEIAAYRSQQQQQLHISLDTVPHPMFHPLLGGDEDDEKQEMTEATEEGGEGGKDKVEEEEKTEDKEATEQVSEKEESGDKGESEAKDEGKEQEEKNEEQEKAEVKKTEQEDRAKPDPKEEKAAEPEKKSQPPQEKEKKDLAVTEKTKDEK
ncbi:hypothetical protein NHX12_027091 [Muraenolepis orangiensis]|uniref:IF rod domain-containing protein n=1 Tax=Muraenolepis orangiensis TaxID=630683 RepID=A0A9Q0ED42_9TELE|nr:hypothetical protein NHX12_027091 [Muraenolepis orangiensis]